MQRVSWGTRQRLLQAFAVLLVASGFYLLLDGSYRIAELAVSTGSPTLSIAELLVGSILIWSGSAFFAESRTIVFMHNENTLSGKATRAQEDRSSSNGKL